MLALILLADRRTGQQRGGQVRSGQVSSDQMGLSPLQVGGGGGQTGVEDIVSVSVTLRQVLPGLRQTHGPGEGSLWAETPA